jgi:hypothetical protein
MFTPSRAPLLREGSAPLLFRVAQRPEIPTFLLATDSQIVKDHLYIPPGRLNRHFLALPAILAIARIYLLITIPTLPTPSPGIPDHPSLAQVCPSSKYPSIPARTSVQIGQKFTAL